ncbi:uncharacterized protein PAC_00329 [Phialocephala subalpina]|uniref:Uncharacterized protein n=1 Tax=Phialocephala subalpina TaxID=576137 RepID=A0A1L7WCF6_9HELO|nr:uncharacterized protein PAC_00329 [Phialocephala subalpina]
MWKSDVNVIVFPVVFVAVKGTNIGTTLPLKYEIYCEVALIDTLSVTVTSRSMDPLVIGEVKMKRIECKLSRAWCQKGLRTGMFVLHSAKPAIYLSFLADNASKFKIIPSASSFPELIVSLSKAIEEAKLSTGKSYSQEFHRTSSMNGNDSNYWDIKLDKRQYMILKKSRPLFD